MTLLFDNPITGRSSQGIQVPAGGRLTLQPFFRTTPDGRRFKLPPRVIPVHGPRKNPARYANHLSDVEIEFDLVPFGKKKRKNGQRKGPDDPKYVEGSGSAVKYKGYSKGATESLAALSDRVQEEQFQELRKTLGDAVAERLATMEAAIQTLDVEFSDRYTPKKGFRCNVYATDFLSLVRPVFDAYLPKQWWRDENLVMDERASYQELVEHEDQTRAQEEGAVNGWLHKWGAVFGWRQLSGNQSEVFDEAQGLANEGRLVVYSWADYFPPGTTGFGGHVGLVVAETDKIKAKRTSAGGRMPVVSQAGSSLYDRHLKGFNLREKEKHGGSPGVFVHEPQNDQSRFSPEIVSIAHKAAEIRPGRLTPSP